MDGNVVKVNYDGLLKEPLPSGRFRYRVRVEGDKNRRITLTVGPEHREFHEIYCAARRGIRLEPSASSELSEKGTVAWLVDSYLAYLSGLVEQQQGSAYTLKQRRSFRSLVLDHKSSTGKSNGRAYAGLPCEIPPHELILFRDSLMATPGKANNVFKFLKAMYKWGLERNHCKTNPAKGIDVDYKSLGGATPWTMDDLEKYRKVHPRGTMAHLALCVFMFTACRIGDAVLLGRRHEEKVNGHLWLKWTPAKKGSKKVALPMLHPLISATRAQTVVGPTYLLTQHGVPFASPEGLRNRFKKWCKEAGLPDRSSHGIRKAAGHLLALHGATQYEIMSIHGHAQASTSQIYTESVERMKLAEMGASKLASLDW